MRVAADVCGTFTDILLRRPDGERFIRYELVVGTWGAWPTADGNDGLSNPCATTANIPVEVAESEFPIMIERYGLVPDSGGPGRFRGGLAIERVWKSLATNTTLKVRSDRQNHAPYGLSGVLEGGRSANLLTDGSGAHSYPPVFSIVTASGTVFHHRMAGRGGWGDPLDREPDAVTDDVRNEKVGAATAREHYGVVIRGDGSVDVVATTGLRTIMRAAG